MKKRIMKFLSVLFISIMTLGILSSCETTYAATYTDDMYYPYDPEYASVNMILEYGVPYYLNGVLQYYIYRDLYYYPFYYNDIMYFRTFYRPLPPNHHYNFGRPHRGDVGFGHHRPHRPHNGVRPHNNNHRPNGNHHGGSHSPQHQPQGQHPSHQPGHTNTTRPGLSFGSSRPSQQRPNTNQRVTTRPSSTRVAPPPAPAESRVFSNPPSTSGGSHSGSSSFGSSSGGSRSGFGGSGGGSSRGSSGGSRGGFGGRR